MPCSQEEEEEEKRRWRREKKTLAVGGLRVTCVLYSLLNRALCCRSRKNKKKKLNGERSRSSEGRQKKRVKRKEIRKEIRNVCCSWGILKIKLTRLSSNDPQFRVTLQVFSLQSLPTYLSPLSTHGKKKPTTITKTMCVCVNVSNREKFEKAAVVVYRFLCACFSLLTI